MREFFKFLLDFIGPGMLHCYPLEVVLKVTVTVVVKLSRSQEGSNCREHGCDNAHET
jgi:hypothetical protein